MKTLSSCNIFSHPEKPLLEHLGNVFQLANLFNILKNEESEKLLKIIAYSHDFAKSTEYFQQYLNNTYRGAKEYKNHAKLSAIFAFYIAKKLNIAKNFIPYISILAHHGNLKDFYVKGAGNIEENQIESINFEEIKEIYADFEELDKQEFLNYIKNDFVDDLYDCDDKLDKTTIEDYFQVLYLFSLLIDADKLDAGFDNKDKIQELYQKIKDFSIPDSVDVYKREVFGNIRQEGLNKLREDLYQDAVNYVKKADLDNKILSINVPTGTGKTLASLAFAFKLRERLIKEKNINPKIIYCLPFTSIIDQNFNVIEDILKANNMECLSHRLLKHHHLAEIDYKEENDEFSTDKSLLLTENWLSSIVITSFMQFFHTLISSRNKSLKKFHNIANSIVILDEIQSVPHKYWKLINKVLNTVSKMFNTYFVLVTATQPMIFRKENNEIVEVIDKKEEYFKSSLLDRIVLQNHLTAETLEEFKPKLLKDINQNKNKSFLIILNTIKSSHTIFDYIKEYTENEDILYLSTTILPKDRIEIINKVKNKTKRVILVSTQVVEAGVDIDLDIVYRDLAPLDSIFQSAGRCNRNSKTDKGIVKVIKLLDENNKNKPYSDYIYEEILLNETKKVLETKVEFFENEFLDLSNSYYKSLVLSNNTSNDILKDMEKLKFETVSKSFKLIEEKTQAIDVFIESSQEAEKLIRKYDEIIKDTTLKSFEKKTKFLEIRSEFYKYVISVNLKRGHEKYFEQSPFNKYDLNPCYIPLNKFEEFYEIGSKGFNFNRVEKMETESILI